MKLLTLATSAVMIIMATAPSFAQTDCQSATHDKAWQDCEMFAQAARQQRQEEEQMLERQRNILLEQQREALEEQQRKLLLQQMMMQPSGSNCVPMGSGSVSCTPY